MTRAGVLDAPPIEHRETFACFGSDCAVIVADAVRGEDARAAAGSARDRLLEWHRRFSRFRADSEISRLNDDERVVVPVSPLMRRIAQASAQAAWRTEGLVDPTLVSEIEQVGYAAHWDGEGLPLEQALALAPQRAPAAPSPAEAWREVEVDRAAGTVTRPPGVRLDAGGIAKGVFADELAAQLSMHDAFVVDCAGDLRLGGRARIEREVHVAGPFDDSILHTFELTQGAVATSGIGRRSWLRRDGRPGHHLLNPRTGEPAFTGVVQVTALAPSATEAEVLAKAAILSGPDRAERWLEHGGLIVLDDGGFRLIR